MCSCSAMAPSEGAAEHTHASRSLASWQHAVPSYSAAIKMVQAGSEAVKSMGLAWAAQLHRPKWSKASCSLANLLPATPDTHLLKQLKI